MLTEVEKAFYRGQEELLNYLIETADKTIGSEVWKQLFKEMRIRSKQVMKEMERKQQD